MSRPPDVEFIPAPARVVQEMLRLAEVTANDLLLDLGCGDGQIAIAAAQHRGARAIGVDLDPNLLAQARHQAERAGVSHLIHFQEQDLFTTDLRPATVVALYLLDSLNVRLRSSILTQCQPGTRVVSYSFEMGEWEPDAHTPMAANGVFLWIVPANLTGHWQAQNAPESLTIQQTFQKLTGTALIQGQTRHILEGRVTGPSFTLTIEPPSGTEPLTLSGQVEGDRMEAHLTGPEVASKRDFLRCPRMIST